MAGTIRFDGADGLRDKFKAMTEIARRDTLATAVQPAAAIMRDAISERAPQGAKHEHDGPRLAYAIETVQLTDSADRFVVGIGIDKGAFYWKFLEFGTVKMAAQPFIRTAFKSTRTQARNEIRDGIRDSVEGFTE